MSEIPDDASIEEEERLLNDAKVAVVKFVRRQVRRGVPIKEEWKRTAQDLDVELKTKSLGSQGKRDGPVALKDSTSSPGSVVPRLGSE